MVSVSLRNKNPIYFQIRVIFVTSVNQTNEHDFKLTNKRERMNTYNREKSNAQRKE